MVKIRSDRPTGHARFRVTRLELAIAVVVLTLAGWWIYQLRSTHGPETARARSTITTAAPPRSAEFPTPVTNHPITNAADSAGSPKAVPSEYEFRRDIRLVQRRKFGIPAGFSVEALGDGAAYRAIGFQPGDIVLGINGRGLRSAEEAIAALQYRLPDQTTEIVVERGGKRVTLTLGPPAR